MMEIETYLTDPERFNLGEGFIWVLALPFQGPPVAAVGSVAKLQTVLSESPDPYRRRHTVFCIALIGGQSAHQILRQSLNRETDSCVASCIRASLTAFANKRRPHHISEESRTQWYTTFLCNGE